MVKTPEDLSNVAELAALGWSIRDACEELGLSYDTVCKQTGRKANPEFQRMVSQIRTERTEALAGKALKAAELAVVQLDAIAQTAEKDSDRVSACGKILDKVLTFAENSELRRRIDELEQAAADKEDAED